MAVVTNWERRYGERHRCKRRLSLTITRLAKIILRTMARVTVETAEDLVEGRRRSLCPHPHSGCGKGAMAGETTVTAEISTKKTAQMAALVSFSSRIESLAQN